jgi:8-oxo-dGTP pyrophosphatase MutT (NUDIX family)
MSIKTGAGVIPFAWVEGTPRFLFHKTFSGRRAGLLVDFGGGSRAGETQYQTAAREFVEETEAMFFADSCNNASDRQAQMESQYQLMLQLIENTQSQHPQWWCRRVSVNNDKPRDWKTYFVEVDYRDVDEMNTAWAEDKHGRFRKRRELLWLTAAQLLDVFDNRPETLWTRVRELGGASDIVRAIAGRTDQ